MKPSAWHFYTEGIGVFIICKVVDDHIGFKTVFPIAELFIKGIDAVAPHLPVLVAVNSLAVEIAQNSVLHPCYELVPQVF